MNGTRHLALSFADTHSLYLAYMPYLRNGGLFSATGADYDLGDEVLVSLSLMDDLKRSVVTGHVVWISPHGTQGPGPAGIGIQFDTGDRGATRKRIEALLAGVAGGDRSTHTM